MNAFKKIGTKEDGYAPFSMFGSAGGTAKYLLNDTVKKSMSACFVPPSLFPQVTNGCSMLMSF